MTNSVDKLDLRPYLWPVIRYRQLIIVFCATAVVTSLALTYILAEKYTATSTILYQPNESISFRPKVRDTFGFPMPIVALESIGSTVEDVLKSDAVLEDTVKTLHLDVKEEPTGSWFARAYRNTKDKIKEWRSQAMQLLKYGRILPRNPFAEAVEGLRENVSVKRTTKAYTFQLVVKDSNPERAARIVDTVAALLSDFLANEQARAAREAQAKIEPRLRASAEEISGLRRRILAFKNTERVAAPGEELTLKLKSVTGFEDELAKTRNELRSLENKRTALEAQLKAQEPSIKYGAVTSDNPVVDDLRRQIARLEVERSGMLRQFTANHPEVQAIDARIKEARDRLKQEQPTIVSSESTRLNDIYQKLLTDKLAADAEIQSLQAKEEALQTVVAGGNSEAKSLSTKDSNLAELTLQLQQAEKSFALITEAYEEARLAEARASSEVSILHKSEIPRAPSYPIKVLHVGTTLLLGLFLSVGFVYLIDFFDPTVRHIAELEHLVGLPVLASVPALPSHQNPERLLLGS
jgi:polysaccharide biosynthesis transport protein